MYPDPNEALAAYGAPAVQPPMVSDQALLDLPSPQVPDPRAALAMYQGQPMPTTSQQALGNMGGAMDAQMAANSQRAQVASDAAKQAGVVQSESGVDASMHGEELRMAQEEHADAVKKLTADDDKRAEQSDNIGDNRSTYDKVAGRIALILGKYQDQNNLVAGLMQGQNVQTNNAAQIANQINQDIERSIALQRGKLEQSNMQAREAKAGESQSYAENTQALQLAHAAKIEQAQAALQSIASQAQSKDVLEAVNGANAKLEEEKQARNMNVLQMREAARAKAAAGANRPQPMDFKSMDPRVIQSMIDAGMPVPTDVREKHAAYVKSTQPPPADTSTDIAGYKRAGDVDKTTHAEAQKVVSATAGLSSTFEQLGKLREEYKATEVWDQGKRDEIAKAGDLLIGNIADMASQIAGGGTSGELAKAQTAEALPSPARWMDVGKADPAAVYARVKKNLEDTSDMKLRGMKYEKAPTQKGGATGGWEGGAVSTRTWKPGDAVPGVK